MRRDAQPTADVPAFLIPVPSTEPPAHDACAAPHTCRPGPLRQRSRPTPHDGRTSRRAATRTLRAPAEHLRVDPAAQQFANFAVRLVLEVGEGRRPLSQLTGVVTPGLVDTFSPTRTAHRPALAGSPSGVRARLRTVDAHAAELFGSYTRGHRVFALAGRIERTTDRGPAPHGWLVTTLWLGR